MKLYQFSNRIWYSAFEVQRDRPALGYIRGDRFGIAVDAGHSKAHLLEFYEALERHHLPEPALTVLTHWHWDHSFALHAAAGLSVCNARTNEHLVQARQALDQEGADYFRRLDESIALEYPGDTQMVIMPAQITFAEELKVQAGNVSAYLMTAPSPHTDDTTLVYVPEEQFLFLGDCISGVFPTWLRDVNKTRALLETLERLPFTHCLGGHWDVFEREQLLSELKAAIQCDTVM